MLVELQRTIVEVSATYPLLVRLLCASIELAVLGVAMALWAQCLRDRWPRVVHWLWLVVLAKPLVSLTLGSPLPVVLLVKPAPELGNAQQVPVERSAGTVVNGDAGANIFDNLAGSVGAESRGIEAWPNRSNSVTPFIAPAESGSVDPARRIALAASPQEKEWTANLSVAGGILGVWWIGVAITAGWHLLGWLRVGRLVCLSNAPDARLAAAYANIGQQLGLRRLPRLRVSDHVESPAIVGYLRSVVLLPRWLGEDGTLKLTWSIRHELTHWRWCDPLAVLIRDLARVLFFFHPLAWWSGRRMVEAMELACDQAMLRNADQASEYAQQLYQILTEVRDRRRVALAGGLFATRTQVGRRIAALLEGTGIGKPQLTTISALGVLAIAAVALAVGGGITHETSEPATTAAASAAEDQPAPQDEANSTTVAGDQLYQVVIHSDGGSPRPNAQVGNFQQKYPGRDFSDEDGRIRLRAKHGDPRLWYAYSQGYRSMGLFQLPAKPDGNPLQVSLTLGVAHIEGLVVDRAGRAVGKRQVQLHLTTAAGDKIPLRTLTTDARGRYWSYHIPAGDGLTLLANLSGDSTITKIELPRAARTIFAPPLVDTEVEIDTEAPAAAQATERFSGQVFDEQGGAIAGAEVSILARIPAGYLEGFFVRTDPQGRWYFESGQGTCEFRLGYSHAGFVSSLFDRASVHKPSLEKLQAGTATVVLKRGFLVHGTVYDANGKPLPDARVLTQPLVSSTPGPIREPIVDESMTRTGEQGRFTTCALPPGKHYLAFYAHRHAPQTVLVAVGPESSEIEVHMQRGDTLAGQVVDPQGKPIDEVRIGVEEWRSPQSYSAVRWDRTDSAGRFRIDHLPTQGSYSLRFYGKLDGNRVEGRVHKADIQPGSPLLLTLGPIEPVVILGKVVDADTGEPVQSIEIIEGEPVGLDRVDFTHGQHVRKTSVDGTFRHEINGSKSLRVHAPGYYPEDTRVYQSGDGTQQVTLQLSRGQPFRGTVVDVTGQPVPEAEVAWVGPQRRAMVENGKLFLRDKRRRVILGPEYVAKTDIQGQFELPPSQAQGLIVVVHTSGYIELPSTQYAPDKPLQLGPWCRIEGVLSRHGKPAADEQVVIQPHSAPQTEPYVIWKLSDETDPQGRFAIANVPPLPLRIGYLVGRELSHVQRVVPNAGQTNTIEFGGNGATVVGRVARTDGLENFQLSGELTTFQHKTMVFAYPRSQANLPKEQRTDYFAQLSGDGQFQIEDVPPGEYHLKVEIHAPAQPNSCGVPLAIAATTALFDVLAADVAGAAMELPPLAPQLRPGLSIGQTLPDISAQTITGEPIELGDFRGKLLVLEFWATWCAPCVAEIPRMKRLHEAYGRSGDVAFVGINVDDLPHAAQALITKHQLSWLQLAAPGWGEKNRLLGQFGVTSIPSIWLVELEGKVLARDLRAAQLEEALRNAGARAAKPSVEW